MKVYSDVIVIGGGINGVCTAFQLAQGGADVTLLEKSFIAGGPTGLSSAIVRQHYSNELTARMALDSVNVWHNFEEITGAEPVFTPQVFMIGVRPEDVEGLKTNIAMQRSIGIDTQFVTPQEMQEIDPNIVIDGIGGGAYEIGSGYCDPSAAADGFAQAAKRLGANIQIGTRVTGFKINKGKISGVETDQGDFSADAVAIIAGPWSRDLLADIGIDIAINTARVKVVIYRPPSELKGYGIWADFISQVYLRPETGGLMMVGSISPEEETEDQVLNPDQFNEKVELDIISSFAERAALRYPAMQHGHLHNSYASLYDITPDWHHIMDAVPGVDGLYVCAGTSGHGFKLGPAVGEMMSALILTGKNPQDNINLFSFDRFKTGDLVRGQYEYSILG